MLNKQLQEEQNTIYEMKAIIFIFLLKLERFLSSVIKNELQHFPELSHTLSSLAQSQVFPR